VSDFTLSTLVLFLLVHFTFRKLTHPPHFTFTFGKANNPEKRERYHT
jgi:hypothetical protein